MSTFLDHLPRGRQLAVDVGNPAYVEWWADLTLEEARRHGWDGVFADNVVRGEFRDGSWSAVPVASTVCRLALTPVTLRPRERR